MEVRLNYMLKKNSFTKIMFLLKYEVAISNENYFHFRKNLSQNDCSLGVLDFYDFQNLNNVFHYTVYFIFGILYWYFYRILFFNGKTIFLDLLIFLMSERIVLLFSLRALKVNIFLC